MLLDSTLSSDSSEYIIEPHPHHSVHPVAMLQFGPRNPSAAPNKEILLGRKLISTQSSSAPALQSIVGPKLKGYYNSVYLLLFPRKIARRVL